MRYADAFALAALIGVGCGGTSRPADLSAPVDQAVARDLTTFDLWGTSAPDLRGADFGIVTTGTNVVSVVVDSVLPA